MNNHLAHAVARRFVERFGAAAAERRACTMSRRFRAAAEKAAPTVERRANEDWGPARSISRYRAELLNAARA